MIIVYCAHTTPEKAPFSYGMLISYARLVLPSSQYDLDLRFIESISDIEKKFVPGAKNILLCSNYYWNVDANLELCKEAKRIDKNCITVHGGPSSPKYAAVCEAFLLSHCEADFVARGEGEELLVELLQAINDNVHREQVINGVTTVIDGKVIRYPDRAPIKDVNMLPSPYLSGIFDSLDISKWHLVPIETNRGCVYSCSFCDWPRSKIRKFKIERVFAEIEWIAQNKCNVLYIIDSNFGMLPRDVEIALVICNIKAKFGFPKRLEVAYAKELKKHLFKIVNLFCKANLQSRGIVAVQTIDQATLDAVNRSNIKFDEIEKLSNLFKANGLPLVYNLMLGLPGATSTSFKRDLRYFFDKEGIPSIHRTVLTPNSNMAEPAYKKKYELECDDKLFIISTSTMSRQDLNEMKSLLALYYVAHPYYLNMLYYMLKYLQHDCEYEVVDLLYQLAKDNLSEKKYPLLASIITDDTPWLTVRATQLYAGFYKNGRWCDLYKEFFSWATQKLKIKCMDAFEQIMLAQVAVMPVIGRVYPYKIDLRYDVNKWIACINAGCGKPLTQFDALTFRIAKSSRPYPEATKVAIGLKD